MLHLIHRHRHNIIPVFVIGAVLAVFLAVALFWIKLEQESGDLETGPETACTQDIDCWCRNFDGAGFLPGKGGSPGCNLKAGTCYPCYYY